MPRGDRAELVHGTVNAYKNLGCRCDACRSAHAANNRARYKLNPEVGRTRSRRHRERHLEKERARELAAYGRRREQWREGYRRRKFGLEPGEFDEMLRTQMGCCAICLTDAPNGKGWCVDHDHETGRVRGILCHSCNVALGHLGDDPNRVRAALAYLEGPG